jgi:hypothetical protein
MVAAVTSGMINSSVIVRKRANCFSETKQVNHQEQLTYQVCWYSDPLELGLQISKCSGSGLGTLPTVKAALLFVMLCYA